LKYKAKLRARKKIQEYQLIIQQTLSAKLWLPDTGDVKPILYKSLTQFTRVFLLLISILLMETNTMQT
jgi:hypothetical protein